MKIFALLAIVFSTSAAFASCPNFNGNFKYVSETTKMKLVAKQTKCKSLDFTYNYANGQVLGKIYALDGVRRNTFENNELVVYESAAFVDGYIRATVEDYYKATKITKSALVYYRIDDKGDLVSQVDYINEHGTITKTTLAQFTRIPGISD